MLRQYAARACGGDEARLDPAGVPALDQRSRLLEIRCRSSAGGEPAAAEAIQNSPDMCGHQPVATFTGGRDSASSSIRSVMMAIYRRSPCGRAAAGLTARPEPVVVAVIVGDDRDHLAPRYIRSVKMPSSLLASPSGNRAPARSINRATKHFRTLRVKYTWCSFARSSCDERCAGHPPSTHPDHLSQHHVGAVLLRHANQPLQRLPTQIVVGVEEEHVGANALSIRRCRSARSARVRLMKDPDLWILLRIASSSGLLPSVDPSSTRAPRAGPGRSIG